MVNLLTLEEIKEVAYENENITSFEDDIIDEDFIEEMGYEREGELWRKKK